MKPANVLIAATLVATVAGCAPRQNGNPGPRNYVSGEDLANTNSRMVYEALETLRPEWLTSRGPISASDPTPARANVYQNGAYVGNLDYLRGVYVIDIAGLTFYPPAEASARFGMGNPRGVIEITLK